MLLSLNFTWLLRLLIWFCRWRYQVIKLKRKKPKLPDHFEESTWTQLKTAIAAVAAKQSITTSYEELYRAVENMCIHKMSSSLYAKLQSECANHISTNLQRLEDQTPDHASFLELVEQSWQEHQSSMITIRSIFLYLDRTYVMQTPAIRSLWEMGLHLFRQNLEQRTDVERKLIDGLLHLIGRERAGEAINRTTMR